ncbi:phenylacetate--CoA ligase family protein [Botrimarina hoheduenensis]|uniref:Phenylacetate-coenzyme A ligase n=1 Tax=Botrimarina hoheduenensis TaxID=2528000 RepID=A0A5C5VV33_9BACT|nr:AMP-binding protein [Botrimarina hoheduenensis]TWT42454.1 Phenylacetate-coenzyme A ligase [Botrimarina hoheduenensis]
MNQPSPDRRRQWLLPRHEIEAEQLDRLNHLLTVAVVSSPLYRNKFGAEPPRFDSLEAFRALPTTSKEELLSAAEADQWRTEPDRAYVRRHETSGTRGKPLEVLDTAEDWQWWIDTWGHVLDAAGIGPGDRALLAFSFGPFIGFWSAFDALVAQGVRVIPGGGMGSRARGELIARSGATVLLATPTYALHLAEELGMKATRSSIKKVLLAGEPGGSIPETRQRIEQAWDAEVIDHAGATEVGPWGFGDERLAPISGAAVGPGLRVIETEFLAEFLSVETGKPAAAGELSHLLLTPLGRFGSPVIRYRTGDLVRPAWPVGPVVEGGCGFVRLEGGVLARADDMMIVRGVNVFPSSIERILHSFPEVTEHRVTVRKRGQMDEIVVEVEDRLGLPERIAQELRLRLGLRIEVQLVTPQSLPRSEGKSRRFRDLRKQPDVVV